MTRYSIVGNDQGQTLTVVLEDEEVVTVPSSHPNYDAIVDHLLSEDHDEGHIRDLIEIVGSLGAKLTQISERVSVGGNSLFFDGDPIDDTLSNHILRLVKDGDERAWKPFVAFLEKLATNPSVESQESLYNWISDCNLTIAEGGDFIAYKGVSANGKSISSGAAYVNGELVRGNIPNQPGSVISMPRSNVNSDTHIGCSTGLHAGTWDYASNFARGQVLEVRINPRDVVSVPDDSAHQKLRVCRYTVVEAIEQEYTESTLYDDEFEDDDDLLDDDFFEDDFEEYQGRHFA